MYFVVLHLTLLSTSRQFTYSNHMASLEVPNLDEGYDAPIFSILNFPRLPGDAMEPTDTAPPEGRNESLEDYSAPIHRILNFVPIRSMEPTDKVRETHQAGASLPPASLGQATASIPRAPILYSHPIDGPIINPPSSLHMSGQTRSPPRPIASHGPTSPNGPLVTMDQAKEMIQVSVREAMGSLKHLLGPTTIWEMAFASDNCPVPLPLWHPERGKSAPNRPLPMDEDDVASRLEERLVTALEKLVAAKGVPNTVSGQGRQEDDEGSNGEPAGKEVTPASKLEYKRVDEVFAQPPTSLEHG
jgi:hypothetical protein